MSCLISIFVVQMSTVIGYKMKRKKITHDRKLHVLYEQPVRVGIFNYINNGI